MTTLILGFAEIPSLANNTAGVVASVGELSLKARTYSREKQFIATNTEPGLELVVFKASVDGTHLGSLDSTYCAEVLTLLNTIRNNFDNTISLDDFLLANAGVKFSSFEHGTIISQDGTFLPSYVSFTHSDNGGVDYKIWFSDAYFLNEYEGYELVIIPPCVDVNALNGSYEDVLAALTSYTYPLQVAGIEAAKGDFPYSELTVYSLDWTDPNDPSITHTIDWTVIGYGKQALRTENILAAIRTYLATEGDIPAEDWVNFFPVLDTVNTFTLIPMWDNIALSAGEGIDSLLRPMITITEILSKGPAIMIGRTESDFKDNAEMFTLLYKNTMVICMPDGNNTEDALSFVGLFPDYTVIELNDQSADRLSAETQSIIVTLDSMVRACYKDTGSNHLTTGTTRIHVGGVNFLEASNNNIVYRMATRESYMAAI